MIQYSKNTAETLVTFHIGRGGRFYNQGHVTFVEQDNTIGSYTDDLFLGYENESALIGKIREQIEEEGKDFSDYESDILDCFTDRNLEKLESVYGIKESEVGEYGWKDSTGHWLDLPENAITGTINIDNDYNTTYVQYLSDCSENELRLILESTNFVSDDVRSYCKEQLGIEEEYEADEED